MKTIITIGFLITVSLFSELTMAGGNYRVNVALKSESKALTEISNNSEQNYEISISNWAGDVLYHRVAQGEKVESRKVFDFSDSEFGVYKVKVKLDGESSEQLVTVTKTGVEVGEIVRKADPVFTFNDNVLTLSFQNQNKDGMSLNMYSDGVLIYEKKLNDSASLNKKFDLSKLNKGDYQVVFSVGNNQFDYELTK
jgi:hypothetical protein